MQLFDCRLAGTLAGLAQNECLGRATTGCRLLQVGEQSLALGVKFRARVVLNILEHLSGIPSHLVDDQVRVTSASYSALCSDSTGVPPAVTCITPFCILCIPQHVPVASLGIKVGYQGFAI